MSGMSEFKSVTDKPDSLPRRASTVESDVHLHDTADTAMSGSIDRVTPSHPPIVDGDTIFTIEGLGGVPPTTVGAITVEFA